MSARSGSSFESPQSEKKIRPLQVAKKQTDPKGRTARRALDISDDEQGNRSLQALQQVAKPSSLVVPSDTKPPRPSESVATVTQSECDKRVQQAVSKQKQKDAQLMYETVEAEKVSAFERGKLAALNEHNDELVALKAKVDKYCIKLGVKQSANEMLSTENHALREKFLRYVPAIQGLHSQVLSLGGVPVTPELYTDINTEVFQLSQSTGNNVQEEADEENVAETLDTADLYRQMQSGHQQKRSLSEVDEQMDGKETPSTSNIAESKVQKLEEVDEEPAAGTRASIGGKRYEQCTTCQRVEIAPNISSGKHYNKYHPSVKKFFTIKSFPTKAMRYIETDKPQGETQLPAYMKEKLRLFKNKWSNKHKECNRDLFYSKIENLNKNWNRGYAVVPGTFVPKPVSTGAHASSSDDDKLNE